MVVHTVLVKTRPGTSASTLTALALRIDDLARTACGPGEYHVGRNVTEEPLDGGYDFGFVLRFPNRGALDAYHVNPAHLAVSLAIRDIADAVLVLDLDGTT